MRCESCDAEIAIGDFPFCPHGRTELAVHQDSVPGGFWAENGFAEPRKFYAKSEHEKALAAEGCEIRAKNAGPDDKICRPWHTVDLEAAAILLTRGTEARADRRARQLTPVPISVENAGALRASDLS